MSPDARRIAADIGRIKYKLDESHDTDQDYMPPLLKELRTYIFQVHANFEFSLEMIIWKDYLATSKPHSDFSLLFEKMSFYDKQRIVHKQDVNFPNAITTRLNELRNHFAHQRGQLLRDEYRLDQVRLDAYKLLEEAHDTLNDYWLQRRGINGTR